MERIMFYLLLLALNLPFAAVGQQNCNLRVEGNLKSPSCAGGMDGAIQVQVFGGVGNYTYVWSNGQASKNITGLTAGQYSLTVKDSHGCVAKTDFNLQEGKSDLELQLKQKSIGNNQYTLEAAFNGGKKPYALTIKKMSDGIRAPQQEYKGQGLSKGIYLVEAFTEAGCNVMQKITIGANESSIR